MPRWPRQYQQVVEKSEDDIAIELGERHKIQVLEDVMDVAAEHGEATPEELSLARRIVGSIEQDHKRSLETSRQIRRDLEALNPALPTGSRGNKERLTLDPAA